RTVVAGRPAVETVTSTPRRAGRPGQGVAGLKLAQHRTAGSPVRRRRHHAVAICGVALVVLADVLIGRADVLERLLVAASDSRGWWAGAARLARCSPAAGQQARGRRRDARLTSCSQSREVHRILRAGLPSDHPAAFPALTGQGFADVRST